METILGLIVGGLTRLAPEILKISDRKSQRKHEIAMQQAVAEYEKARAGGDPEIPRIALDNEALATMRAAVESQSRPTLGVVDALSASVRPMLTYTLLTLYATAKVAIFASAMRTGVPWDDAAAAAWGESDMAMFSGVVSYWFLSRTMEKSGSPYR